jgi:hypothetical protein
MNARSDWVDRARCTNIGAILAQRNVRLHGRGHAFKGACPRCGGTDRFAVHTGKQLFFCRQCGIKGHGSIDLIMALDSVDFVDAVERITGEPPPNGHAAQPDPDRERRLQEERAAHERAAREREQDQQREESARRDLARRLWLQRQPISEGSPPALYLAKRGFVGAIPATLGYLAPNGKYPPTMIATFAMAGETEPGVLAPPVKVDQVHLTRLTMAGDKANADPDHPAKIVIGLGTGLPIVLAPPNDLLGLAITEGIEDGLSVYASTGLGTWVAGAAGRLPALAAAVPDYIDCVTIYAHPDEAGRRGARELARALAPRVEIFLEGI